MHYPLAIIAISIFLSVQLVLFRRAVGSVRTVIDTLGQSLNAWRQAGYSNHEMSLQLEVQLRGGKYRSTLYRMNSMAPLLGVILTAIGFIFLPHPVQQEGTTTDAAAVFRALGPLYVGVLAGASLGFLNQILLQLHDAKCEFVRLDFQNRLLHLPGPITVAATEFATGIAAAIAEIKLELKSCFSNAQESVHQLEKTTSRTSQRLEISSEQQVSNAQSLNKATASMTDAIQTMTSTLSSFETSLQQAATKIDGTASRLRSAGNSLALSESEVSKVLNTAASQLTTTSQSNAELSDLIKRNAIQSQDLIRNMFVDLQPQLRNVCESLNGISETCTKSANTLQSSASLLLESSASMSKNSTHLSTSSGALDQKVQDLAAHINSLGGSISEQEKLLTQTPMAVTKLMEQLGAAVRRYVSQMGQQVSTDMDSELRPAIEKASAHMAMSAEACIANVKQLTSATNAFRQGATFIGSGEGSLLFVVGQLNERMGGIQQAILQLAKQVNNQTAVLGSIPDQLSSIHQSFESAAHQIELDRTNSLDQFAGLMQSVESTIHHFQRSQARGRASRVAQPNSNGASANANSDGLITSTLNWFRRKPK